MKSTARYARAEPSAVRFSLGTSVSLDTFGKENLTHILKLICPQITYSTYCFPFYVIILCAFNYLKQRRAHIFYSIQIALSLPSLDQMSQALASSQGIQNISQIMSHLTYSFTQPSRNNLHRTQSLRNIRSYILRISELLRKHVLPLATYNLSLKVAICMQLCSKFPSLLINHPKIERSEA